MVSDLRSLGKIERPSLLDIGKLTATPSLDFTDEEVRYGTHRTAYELNDVPGLNDRLNALADKTQAPWYSRLLQSFGFGTQPFIRAYETTEHLARGGEAPKPSWKRMIALQMAPAFSGYPALIGDLVRSISGIDPVSRAWGSEIMQRRQMTPAEIGAEALGAFGTGLLTMVPQLMQTILGLDEIAQARAPAIAAPRMLSFTNVLRAYEPYTFQSAEDHPLGWLHDTPLLGPLVFGGDEANWGDLLGLGLDLILDVNWLLPAGAYIKAGKIGGQGLLKGGGRIATPAAKLIRDQELYKSASGAMYNLLRHAGVVTELDMARELREFGEVPKHLVDYHNRKAAMLQGISKLRRRISTGLSEHFHIGQDLGKMHDAFEQLGTEQARAAEWTYTTFAKEAEQETLRILDEELIPEVGDYKKAFYHIDPDAKEASPLRRRFHAGRDPKPAIAALQDYFQRESEPIFDNIRNLISEHVEEPIEHALEAYKMNPDAAVGEPMFDYVKAWIEQMQGAPDARAIFDDYMKTPSVIEHYSQDVTDALDAHASDLASRGQGSLGRAFRRFAELNGKWQRRIEEDLPDWAERELAAWVPQVLGRVHTMRAWAKYMDPIDFARGVEGSNILQAIELDSKARTQLQRSGRLREGPGLSSSPYEHRSFGRTMAMVADDEGVHGQLVRAGVTIGKQSGKALMVGPQELDQLGRLSWIDSSFKQFEIVHSRRARRLWLNKLAEAEHTNAEGLARQVFEGIDIPWERLAERFRIPIEAAEEGAPMTGDMVDALGVLARQDAEDAAVWLNRLVDDFGAEDAMKIRQRYDTAMWRYIGMPNSPYWGPLADQVLPRNLAAALLRGPGHAGHSGPSSRVLRNLAGLWKGGKTRWSPSWWGRNWVSNKILTYQQFGWDVKDHHFTGALRDLSRWMYKGDQTDPILRAAADYTDMLHSTFGYSEAKSLAGRAAGFEAYTGAWPKQAWEMMKRGFAAVEKAATFSELWDKVAIFKRYYPELRLKYMADEASIPQKILDVLPPGLERGTKEFAEAAAAKEGARLANKALFHYGKVPPAVNFLRGYGIIPFITFPYKALPAVFESAIKHPARFGVWGKMFDFIEDVEKNWDTYEAAEPDWMRTGGWIGLPLHDEKGRKHFLDLTYVLPWGDIAEHGSMFLANRQPSGHVTVNPNIPFLTWIVEMTSGRDLYLDRDIWDATDSLQTRFDKGMAKLAQNVLPPIMFGAGPGNKVVRELARRHPRFRAMYEKIPVVGGVLEQMWMPGSEMSNLALLSTAIGLKTRPFDLEKERKSRVWEIQEAIANSRSNQRRLAKDFVRTDMDPARYMEKYEAENQRLKRWLDENDFLKWLSDQRIAPSRLYGDM